MNPKMNQLFHQKKIRIGIVMVVVALISIVAWFLNQDSIEKRSRMVGDAALNNRVDYLWSMIRQSEREESHLTEANFKKFWQTLVVPQYRNFNAYHLEMRGVDARDVLVTGASRYKVASYTVVKSGDEYYIPDLVSHTCFFLAGYDRPAPTAQDLKKDAGQKVIGIMAANIAWLQKNREKLEACGLPGLKTFKEKPYRSIDELIMAYQAEIDSILAEKASATSTQTQFPSR